MKRFVNSLVKFNCGKNVYAVLVLCAATRIALPGQTFTTLVNFDGANGSIPYYGTLAQGTDGNFYGATFGGGAHGRGAIFKMSSEGSLTVLHSFNSSDGFNPASDVVLGLNGLFYGTTRNGGTVLSGYGTVFSITPGES